MLGDTRACTLASGGLLAVGVVGLTAAATDWPLARGQGAAGLWSLGWLAVVALIWFRAAALLALAERPVADGLGELRRRAGAPVDPSVPWVPFSVRPMAAADLGWDQVRALIGAATVRHALARLALRWAVIAAGGLCIWTVAMIAFAALN